MRGRLSFLLSLFALAATVLLLDAASAAAAAPPSFLPAVNYYGTGGLGAVADFNQDGTADIASPSAVLLSSDTGDLVERAITAGSASVSIVAGDFNNDGKADLVADGGTSGTNGVAMLLGNGHGGFTLISSTVGSGVDSLVAADFNRDGNFDLAGLTATGISLLLGNGQGGFAAGSIITTSVQPTALVVADFDGDGRADLAGLEDSYLVVRLGDGSGGFGAASTTWLNVALSSLAAADINHDGKAEIITVSAASNSGTVFVRNSAGGFNWGSSFATAQYPRGIALTDFNGDGHLDLAVACRTSNAVSVLAGDGTGVFGVPSNYGTNYWPSAVVTGDFNGDGRPDIATYGRSGTISILYQAPARPALVSFAAAVNYPTVGMPRSVAVGDFNQDGKRDLVIGDLGSARFNVLIGDGHGGFGPPSTFATPNAGLTVAVGDFNGDGKDDVAATYGSNIAGDSNGVAVFLNLNGSLMLSDQYLLDGFSTQLVVGDFNKDAKDDLVTSTGHLLLSTPIGHSPVLLSRTLTPYAAGDFNGDGNLDIAGASADGVFVLLGNGAGAFATAIDSAVGAGLTPSAAGDFNGDGNLDLAAPSAAVLFGDGSGRFAPQLLPGGAITGSVPGDFNNDGMTDLAGCQIIGGAYVTLSHGALGFGAPISFDVGSATIDRDQMTLFAAGAADFNGDGRPDLAVAIQDYTKDEVSILLNTTALPFSSICTYPFAGTASSGWQRAAQELTIVASASLASCTIHYSTDGGAHWTSVVGEQARVVVGGEGSHHVLYYASAGASVEAVHDAGYVNIDSTPPLTTSTGIPSGWTRSNVTVKLTASDALSRVVKLQYRQGGEWTDYAGPIVVRNQGVTQLSYRSSDVAGNVSQTGTATVRIDRTGPTTTALRRVTVKKGRTATFRYMVSDITPTATVTIKVFKGARAVWGIRLGSRTTNKTLKCQRTCKLKPGRYVWKVYATDLAGNEQRRMSTRALVVKPLKR